MAYAGAASGKYAYYLFVQDWPELIVATNELEARLRRAGRPLAADMLLRAYVAMRAELLALGRLTAAEATRGLKRSEHDTRVRPDTDGHGGKRLGDYLLAEPLPEQSLLPGSVGLADEELLDNNVPWWPTNEAGSSAHVGRKLFGFFYGQDDASPPSPDEFRVHPLFMPAPARSGGGRGIIEHAIPARRFIRHAIPAIEREWTSRFQAIKDAFDGELTRAFATYE